MLEQAAGGTLLTGIGGDELWNSSRLRTPGPRRRLLQLAPKPLRRLLLGTKVPIDYAWLRPKGRRAARREAAGEALALPGTVRASMESSRGMRYTAVGCAALDVLAADAGASIAHPLLDL